MRVSYSAALLGAILGVACLPKSSTAQNRSDYRVATSSPAVSCRSRSLRSFSFIKE